MPSSRLSSTSAHRSQTLNLNQFDDPGTAPCSDSAYLPNYPLHDESSDDLAASRSSDYDNSSRELHTDFADSDLGSLEPDFADNPRPLPSDDTHPSLSRCSSSSSIITHATLGVSGRTDQADLDAETLESRWTDDKHRSYLTFMEENFVRDMYDREYCALDLCGQSPCTHSVTFLETEPSIHQFKSWKDGDWQWRSMSKHFSNPSMIHQTLFRNPWINHFSKSNSVRSEVDSTQKKDGNGNKPRVIRGKNPISERAPCCQSATSRKIDNTSNCEIEGARDLGKDAQHLPSFLNPGKRNLQLSSERRATRRQKLCDEHTPADDRQ